MRFQLLFEFLQGSFRQLPSRSCLSADLRFRCPNRAQHSCKQSDVTGFGAAQLVPKLLRLSNTLRYEVLVPRPRCNALTRGSALYLEWFSPLNAAQVLFIGILLV